MRNFLTPFLKDRPNVLLPVESPPKDFGTNEVKHVKGKEKLGSDGLDLGLRFTTFGDNFFNLVTDGGAGGIGEEGTLGRFEKLRNDGWVVEERLKEVIGDGAAWEVVLKVG